jgi:hypothetical protein
LRSEPPAAAQQKQAAIPLAVGITPKIDLGQYVWSLAYNSKSINAAMEKRVQDKVTSHINSIKGNLSQWVEVNVEDERLRNGLLNLIAAQTTVELKKDDFSRRRRTTNNVPKFNRCMARLHAGTQCTRRRREGGDFCGTHVRGQPYGIFREGDAAAPTEEPAKVSVETVSIKGISYYIDDIGNVYHPQDVINGKVNPRVIASYTTHIVGDEKSYTLEFKDGFDA